LAFSGLVEELELTPGVGVDVCGVEELVPGAGWVALPSFCIRVGSEGSLVLER